MKKFTLYSLIFIALNFVKAQPSKNFTTYKLNNGLTIILDKDNSQSQVVGIVATNAGSKDEEKHATGLAHYLEHMLFKGTQTLGTSNWDEEKPLIKKIYLLYDKLQVAKTQREIQEINEEINKISQKASKYVIPNELSKLVEQMGGVGLNASTSFDVTEYHNTFPSNQLERWLDLYAHRFQNPVFRTFQTELEAVYEEKNRAEDNPSNAYSKALLKNAFEEHPYSRPIIGYTDHLKKPNMTEMRKFFEKWYVPNNMVLILSGNFELEKAKKLIADKFEKWESKPLPKRNLQQVTPFEKKKTARVKLSSFLKAELIYKNKPGTEKEEIAMDVAAELLSNHSQTGLLDKLSLDGEVLYANASSENLKDGSIFTVRFAPIFDFKRGRQLSFNSAEPLIKEEVEKLKKGEYKAWLLEHVKATMIDSYELAMENPMIRARMFLDAFIRNKKIQSVFKYKEELANIDKETIGKVIRKYIDNNYLGFYSYKGEKGKEKIKKPSFDPIKPEKHTPSEYAQKFTKIPTTDVSHKFVDFKTEVTAVPFQDKVNLFYVKNKRNNVFTMRVVFHVGTHKLPKLNYAVSLMNNAGVMGQYKPDELRKEIGKLGITYRFSVNEDYTTLNLQGREDKLAEACQLMSRLILLPKIESKSLDRIKSSEYYSREEEKKRINLQISALAQYILYGDKSSKIDRISMEDLISISPSDLTTEFNKAISYNADIHYYGKLSLGQVRYILKKNLAFAANRVQGISPELKPKKKYTENTIFLTKNKDAAQSQIFIYVGGNPIPLEKRPIAEAFNQYFGGGFNGLIMKEIREYRSLAYTAGASIGLPLIPSRNSYLGGSIGTQADKTVESVKVVTDLLNNMPENKDWMAGIKDYLINSSYLARPSDRRLSYNVYNWKLAGYNEDPIKFNLPYYKKMTFDDMVNFYKQELKKKPYVIGIVGDDRKIDIKALKQYGNVKIVDQKNLFSKE